MVVVRNIQAITPICLFSWIQEQTSVSLKVLAYKRALADVVGPCDLNQNQLALSPPLSPASGCNIISTALVLTEGDGIFSSQRDAGVNKMTSSAKARTAEYMEMFLHSLLLVVEHLEHVQAGICLVIWLSRLHFSSSQQLWKASEPRNTNTMAWFSSLQTPLCHGVNTNTG